MFSLEMHEIRSAPAKTSVVQQTCHPWVTRLNQITLQRKNWTRLNSLDLLKQFYQIYLHWLMQFKACMCNGFIKQLRQGTSFWVGSYSTYSVVWYDLWHIVIQVIDKQIALSRTKYGNLYGHRYRQMDGNYSWIYMNRLH